MNACRICLVREKKIYKDGRVIFTLAIWSFSDDMTIRFEQKSKLFHSELVFIYANNPAVDERAEIIPFTSYFQSNKVAITVPTEVTYHRAITGSKPLKSVRTTWVNYYFKDEEGNII
jgi:hypothetical protein